MRQLKRKIEISLFVFLCVFAILINLIAYYILSDYNNKHYIALAKSHMEQQYQNTQQSIAVLGEQIRMLGDNAQFTGEINRRDWSAIVNKMDEFRQSSGNISSLSVYIVKNENLIYSRGDSDMRYKVMEWKELKNIWSWALNEGENAIWFLRQVDDVEKKCLSYLMPIYDKDQAVGFLLADMNLETFVNNILKGELLWTESISIASQEEYSQNGIFSIGDDNIIAVRGLTQSNVVLVQTISLKLEEMLLPVKITFSCIFLVSLIVIYFGVKFISKSIIIPLNDLKNKMDRTLSQ